MKLAAELWTVFHRGLRDEQERKSMDLIMLAVIGGFFLLSWGFIRLCEKV
jgi:hypothetical protein